MPIGWLFLSSLITRKKLLRTIHATFWWMYCRSAWCLSWISLSPPCMILYCDSFLLKQFSSVVVFCWMFYFDLCCTYIEYSLKTLCCCEHRWLKESRIHAISFYRFRYSRRLCRQCPRPFWYMRFRYQIHPQSSILTISCHLFFTALLLSLKNAFSRNFFPQLLLIIYTRKYCYVSRGMPNDVGQQPFFGITGLRLCFPFLVTESGRLVMSVWRLWVDTFHWPSSAVARTQTTYQSKTIHSTIIRASLLGRTYGHEWIWSTFHTSCFFSFFFFFFFNCSFITEKH